MTTGARIFWGVIAGTGALVALAAGFCAVMSIIAVVLGHG